mgnify:CR=1 FL=1
MFLISYPPDIAQVHGRHDMQTCTLHREQGQASLKLSLLRSKAHVRNCKLNEINLLGNKKPLQIVDELVRRLHISIKDNLRLVKISRFFSHVGKILAVFRLTLAKPPPLFRGGV